MSLPDTGHPKDHAPYWLFLRQIRRPAESDYEEVLDVFYCAYCIGRVEVLDRIESTLGPNEEARRKSLLPTLGSATRSS